MEVGWHVAWIASLATISTAQGHRASFDLECPVRDLEIIEIDYDTRGVRGCGRQATYVEHRQDDGWTWLMNSDIRSKAAAQPVADGAAPRR